MMHPPPGRGFIYDPAQATSDTTFDGPAVFTSYTVTHNNPLPVEWDEEPLRPSTYRRVRNWIARAVHSFFYGKPQPRWTDGPEAHEVLQNILAPCLRPAGDPRKMRHYYGRANVVGGRFDICIRCGTPNPYNRPAAPPAVREETP